MNLSISGLPAIIVQVGFIGLALIALVLYAAMDHFIGAGVAVNPDGPTAI